MDEEASTPDSPAPKDQAETVIMGALVNSRAEQAYELKLAGMPLREIADRLGYASAHEVTTAIAAQMRIDAKFLSEAGRTGILQMEMDRLDRLQEKLWPAAMMGDPKSVDAVLHVMDRRIKITGIDAVDASTQQHTVLVVGGNEADYISKLKELTDD